MVFMVKVFLITWKNNQIYIGLRDGEMRYKTQIGRIEFEEENIDDLMEVVNQYHYDHSHTYFVESIGCERVASVHVDQNEMGNKNKERWDFWAFDIDGATYISRVCHSGIWRHGNNYKAGQWERAAKKLGVAIEQIKCNEDEWLMGE